MAGTVLLYLFAGSLARRRPNPTKAIQSLYIPVPSPFPALESFIDQCVQAYNLDLFHCVSDTLTSSKQKGSDDVSTHWRRTNGDTPLPVESVASPEPTPNNHPRAGAAVGKSKGGEGMRRGLELYKERYPNIDAILVGTRRGDPHGGGYLLSSLPSLPFIAYSSPSILPQN